MKRLKLWLWIGALIVLLTVPGVALYRSARTLGDAEAIASGDPKRIERRAKNKLLGRALGRAGIWRYLWR